MEEKSLHDPILYFFFTHLSAVVEALGKQEHAKRIIAEEVVR
jgi:hypothetical protein